MCLGTLMLKGENPGGKRLRNEKKKKKKVFKAKEVTEQAAIATKGKGKGLLKTLPKKTKKKGKRGDIYLRRGEKKGGGREEEGGNVGTPIGKQKGKKRNSYKNLHSGPTDLEKL